MCPYNKRFATPNNIEEFAPSEALKAMTDNDWEKLDEKAYAKISPHSPLKRAGMEAIRRNVEACLNDNHRQ